MTPPGTLIIDHGDLPGLVAASLADQPHTVVLWHPLFTDRLARRRQRALYDHAELLSIDQVVEHAMPVGSAPQNDQATLGDAAVLVLAAQTAVARGCQSITWTIQPGRDFAKVSLAAERAQIVGHLLQTVPGAERLTIRTPFLDLSDVDLVDLANRSDAPLQCWWDCQIDRPTPCGSCPSCRRWMKAFETARVVWSWPRMPNRGEAPDVVTCPAQATSRPGASTASVSGTA